MSTAMIQADCMLTNATVLTVNRDRRIIRDGAVAFSGSTIVAVGKAAELAATVSAREILDCAGKLVMPGLVNARIHFYHTMHRGLSPEELPGWLWSNWVHGKVAVHIGAEDEIAGALVVMLEMLNSGTTTFLEAGSYKPAAVIEAISRIGMRGMIGRRSFDQAILGHSMLLEDTETCLCENRKFLKAYRDGYNGGLVRACVDLVGIGRCSDRLYQDSKRMADEFGTMLNFHLATFGEEVTETRMRTGLRPVEHAHSLGIVDAKTTLVHMIHVNDREIELLRDAGANVTHCPDSALKLNLGLFEKGRFPEMMARGVNVAVGSDCSDTCNTSDLIRTMWLAALLPKGYRGDPSVMNAELAIEMTTINGARAMGLENEIGSLEIGKLADIIVLDMRRPEWFPNHSVVQNLVFSTSGDAVETVFVHGRPVMRDRRVLTIDEGEVLDRCATAAEALLARTGLSVPSKWPVV